jgi:hypothetical protein
VVLQNHWLCAARAFAVTAGSGLYKTSPKEAQGRVFPNRSCVSVWELDPG